ncbi:MAG: hypothetical protein NTV94_01215 [Planctomycetota bacterium]|nr:hypothetical protein [Planctomycetota bacterium]
MSQHAMKMGEVEALLGQGRAAEARVVCQRLAQSAPRDPGVQRLMSQVLLSCGQPAPALHYAQVASALVPGHVGLMLESANLLIICGKAEKALEVLAKAQKAEPGNAAVLSMRAGALLDLNRCVESLETCERACAIDPQNPGLISQHAACLLNVGRAPEAMERLLPLAQAPGASSGMIGGAALVSNYCSGWTRSQQLALHAAYGAALERELGPTPVRDYPVRGDGKVRIGIVSPDLRSHSVAWFIEPLFEHLDRSKFEIVVYQTNALADAVTARLKAMVPLWRVMDTVSDAGLAEAIFADRVDVLVELSGHTHAHSLGCMHLRPAPVQLTYLGYPNVTGVRSMDGRVVDAWTDPVGVDEAGCEVLMRMDRPFICYKPPRETRGVGPVPCRGLGRVTFGSFNNAQKLNQATIALWAKLLAAVPGSRLLLKGVAFSERALREEVLARFAAHGADRVEILPRAASTAEHLALYDQVDIGLDPVPYNGTTTTCEALWMGVPVVTLAGTTHAGRVGVSLLEAVALGELVAGDEAAYVQIAEALAGDMDRLSGLRAGLRGRMEGSALCDGPGFCRGFEAVVLEAVRARGRA